MRKIAAATLLLVALALSSDVARGAASFGNSPPRNATTGGGSGSIATITSTGGTLTVTNPTGPTTNLEVNGGGVVFTNGVATGAIQLSTLGSSSYSEGQLAYVASLKALFDLEASTATTVALVNFPATGKSGYEWVRKMIRSPIWEVQTTWTIDPTNTTTVASDENTGIASGAPLLTWSELARRLRDANVTTSITVAVLGSMQSGDKPVFTYHCVDAATVTFTGTATSIYSGTVGSFTLMTVSAAAADDAELFDASIAGGSFTSAGALAKGVMLRATTGNLAQAYALKDLGTTTVRTSRPMTSAGANTTFTAGDSYQIVTLPQILSFRAPDLAPASTILVGFDYHCSTSALGFPAVRMTGCYLSQAGRGVVSFAINCCVDTGTYLNFNNSADYIRINRWLGGAFKGSGGTGINLGYGYSIAESTTLCFEGCILLIENGVFNSSQLCFYDCTSACIQSGTGGRVHMITAVGTSGVIGGKGNTGKLFFAAQSSQIVSVNAIAAGSAYASASTSDATPVQSGSTTSTTAIALDANMNGVFQTQ